MDAKTQNPPPSLPPPLSLPLPPPQTQALPSITHITSLTNPLPEAKDNNLPYTNLPIRAPDPRDSGNWSQSKHSSGVSNNGIHLQSILNSEDSPSRISVPETPLSAKPGLHPPPQQQLPSINSGFDPRASLDANSLLDSRRSSVDSRMNAGISHLAISPSSPYDSQNVSRTSLVSNLQQQRGIATDARTNGSGPISPLGQRSGIRPAAAPRRAPIINPNPRSVSGMPDPTAAAPTKGFPWAFPDQQELPDGQRRSSSSSLEQRPSRQNSFAASVNSSIITVDSALPPGQKRFSEDMQHTHHHTLQHRSISSVQSGDLGPGGAGAGSYSRTPELRVSHKMAERKRRSEMKNLFDELNQILPANTGGKSSKWEVLTRAIDYIKQQKHDVQRLSDIHRDATNLRTEVEKSRQENSMLREEVNSLWQGARRLEPNGQHIFGPYTSQLAAHEQPSQPQPQPQAQPQPPPPALPRALPPPQSHWNQGSSMMQGVEYQPGQSFERR